MMATGGFPRSDFMTIFLSFSVIFLLSFSMVSMSHWLSVWLRETISRNGFTQPKTLSTLVIN